MCWQWLELRKSAPHVTTRTDESRTAGNNTNLGDGLDELSAAERDRNL